MDRGHILALAGGVGGAKLALGLSRVLPPGRLTIVVNTGDDESFHGLHVSPDLDTVMYTLAGVADPERGWGVAGDTFQALEMLRRYGAPTWFNLGDRDLATHVRRTELLRQAYSLSQVTHTLSRCLGIQHSIVPMSDQPVRTIAVTDEGEMSFQTYFVQRRCEPRLCGVRFQGSQDAQVAPGFQKALQKASVLVYCPSNPVVSIGPILAIHSVAQAIATFKGPRLAVSPIVGGQALRGPAAKMLAELGEEVSCVGIARRLAGLCDTLIIDTADEGRAPQVEALGLRPHVTNTIMETDADKVRLAQEVCTLASVV